MKNMKRTVSVVLMIFTLFSLAGCRWFTRNSSQAGPSNKTTVWPEFKTEAPVETTDGTTEGSASETETTTVTTTTTTTTTTTRATTTTTKVAVTKPAATKPPAAYKPKDVRLEWFYTNIDYGEDEPYRPIMRLPEDVTVYAGDKIIVSNPDIKGRGNSIYVDNHYTGLILAGPIINVSTQKGVLWWEIGEPLVDGLRNSVGGQLTTGKEYYFFAKVGMNELYAIDIHRGGGLPDERFYPPGRTDLMLPMIKFEAFDPAVLNTTVPVTTTTVTTVPGSEVNKPTGSPGETTVEEIDEDDGYYDDWDDDWEDEDAMDTTTKKESAGHEGGNNAGLIIAVLIGGGVLILAGGGVAIYFLRRSELKAMSKTKDAPADGEPPANK